MACEAENRCNNRPGRPMMRRPHLHVLPTQPRRPDVFSRLDLFGGLGIVVALVVSVYVVVSLTHHRTKLSVSAYLGHNALNDIGR